MIPHSDSGQLELRDYLAVLQRRKLTIVLITLVVVGTSVGALNGAFAGNRIASANRGSTATMSIGVRTQRFAGTDFIDESSDFNIAVFC